MTALGGVYAGLEGEQRVVGDGGAACEWGGLYRHQMCDVLARAVNAHTIGWQQSHTFRRRYVGRRRLVGLTVELSWELVWSH